MFAPALKPFPAQIWEFSGLEGKSLERSIRKRERERERESEHRICLKSAEEKKRKGSVRSGSAGGRESVEPACSAEGSGAEHRKQGDWEDHG